jgi:hypothetical protein
MRATGELSLRQQTLLAFLGGGDGQEIDPVRIMKGLFLFGQEAPSGWIPAEGRYDFEPYNYGPCSFDIYADLDALQRRGYIRTTAVAGRSWQYYSLTAAGVATLGEVVASMHPEALRYLGEIRQFVMKLPFRSLLQAVYQRYPDYAVNSVFR